MNTKHGFTIVELLIVIVVIGILAAITIVAFNGVQDRARMNKIQSDLASLEKAIKAARINNGDVPLRSVTGVPSGTASTCAAKPAGTDLAALPKTDACWVDYEDSLNDISQASGIVVRSLVDPWGRPYLIDENENETGPTYCVQDIIGAYARPLNGWVRMSGTQRQITNASAGCI